ncbi:MAG: FtsW/RodA/SpoVE family cell cycle protein [Armatimonadetes bacterium]|nr:FtsW/RodA/SpoVE family cell cycle protein [Armatimonadota bacterium]
MARREASSWSPVQLRNALLMLTVVGIFGGLWVVYSASHPYASFKFGDPFAIIVRQIAYTFLGLILFIIAFKISLSYLRFGWLLHLLVIFLLFLTLFWGKEVNEARRWFSFGLFQFQPSEFAKVTLIVFVSSLARQWMIASTATQKFFTWFAIFAFWMLTVALVAVQPHLSGGLLLAAIGISTMFFARLPLALILATLLLGISFGYLGQKHFLRPYQKERWHINSLLVKAKDENDNEKVYQVRQALLGLQVGGLFGQGYDKSRQKRLFLPSAHNDFIFAVIGEEFGFAGSFFVLLFFASLAYFGLCVALMAKDAFSSGLAGGIAFSLWLQAILHISVNANLLPPTGIPLPFVSAGGSSLCATLLGMGLLLNVSNDLVRKEKQKGGAKNALDNGRWWDWGSHLPSHSHRHRY